MGEVDVVKGLARVNETIASVCQRINRETRPRLVAVSKTKPAELVVQAYEAGQRHFGENYIQELVEKARHPAILGGCTDIRWHFIGRLQRNKVSKLVAVPNLFMVETVDSEKTALALDKAWAACPPGLPLRVLVQVNTSQEPEKNGCEPEQAGKLFKFIKDNCPNLNCLGLMTIGKLGYDSSLGPNPDFIALNKCREELCQDLQIDPETLELSMGMSDSYEQAIQLGSTNIRVGSTIFGYRAKPAQGQAPP